MNCLSQAAGICGWNKESIGKGELFNRLPDSNLYQV